MSVGKKKILIICTEDWFFRSHFLPLARLLATRKNWQGTLLASTGSAADPIRQTGMNVRPFAFRRASMNPFVVLLTAVQLARAIRQEKPDLIHFIALKPVLLGLFARWFTPSAAIVFHVTGLGTLAESNALTARIVRWFGFSWLNRALKGKRARLVCENRDDLAYLDRFGGHARPNALIVGGAGVDPDAYPGQTRFRDPPAIGFVGRLIHTKGVDVLVQAHTRLIEQGLQTELFIYGEPDPANPASVSTKMLDQWRHLPHVHLCGATRNIPAVWKKCEICVIPTRTREGMPRAMLEAAASGRALIVTDIPGCHEFVRNGIEGLIVPPEDSPALARALATLIADAKLRRQYGAAARQRVLDGFTEAHLQDNIARLYQGLLA